ncbi:MAG TPA: sigma-54 dependent transcriptional regulator, partial [Polyangiaceae bacterium]|nr:sigma-54 dependent transcriptional regulator [Polyangiaceae bacterium]
ITGETGTGKELVARAIHRYSPRAARSFVAVNLAALPPTLIESELFGHERGAFTGANDRARGKVEAAEHGTLFLDEIGEMPLAMQSKLLRFLENRRFMRVGGSVKIEANIRLMFATLRPLREEVAAGRFRADLFYRIQGITLNVPGLRERRADIAPLLAQFLAQLSARHGVRQPRLGRQVKTLLLRYDWPGNVRELRNVVETLCLLRDGRQVRIADLPECVRLQSSGESRGAAEPERELVLNLDDGLDAMLGQIIEAALDAEEGNKARAAARLKVSLRTIQRHVASGLIHNGARETKVRQLVGG